jgi:hypothetical protein
MHIYSLPLTHIRIHKTHVVSTLTYYAYENAYAYIAYPIHIHIHIHSRPARPRRAFKGTAMGIWIEHALRLEKERLTGLFEVTTYYKLLCIFYDKKMHQVHDTFEPQSHDSTEFLLGAGL